MVGPSNFCSPWPVAIAIRLAQTFIEKQPGFSSQKAEVCCGVGQKHIANLQHENPEQVIMGSRISKA